VSEPVFVITPIGGPGGEARRRADDLFELVIAPVVAAVNEAGGHDLQPIRGDMIERPGSITDAIVDHILTSKVVIVDLAGLNPNVLYEMGIADSFGIPTVRLSDDPDSLPFDARDHNAIELVSAEGGALLGRDVESCKVALQAQVTHALADDFTPTSIVVRHAKVAKLDALTANLDSGDAQDKALAAVLEKLSDLEARLPVIDKGLRRGGSGSIGDESRLAGLPSSAMGLLIALVGTDGRPSVDVTFDRWSELEAQSPKFAEALQVLTERDIAAWVSSDVGAGVLRPRGDPQLLRSFAVQADKRLARAYARMIVEHFAEGTGVDAGA
jgi:hypothetical protein